MPNIVIANYIVYCSNCQVTALHILPVSQARPELLPISLTS